MRRKEISFFLLFIISFSALFSVTVYLVVNDGKPVQIAELGLVIFADVLSEKPADFFVLENPDRYVLEALSNADRNVSDYVIVGDWGNSGIVNLVDSAGTSNVEYNGHYYQLDLVSSHSRSNNYGGAIKLMGIFWVLWAIVMVALYTTYVCQKKK